MFLKCMILQDCDVFQLRVGLSPLKGHKWCHNFIDTPSGVCHCNQGIEDTSHFLLSCPSYVIQRVNLVSSANEILLKANKNHSESQLQLYLYGDPSINNSDNKNILPRHGKGNKKKTDGKYTVYVFIYILKYNNYNNHPRMGMFLNGLFAPTSRQAPAP